MKIEIHKLLKRDEEESAIFRIFEVTSNIQKAIDLLEIKNSTIVAKNIATEESTRLNLASVLYAEYLERNIYLYTKEATFSIRLSLAAFLTEFPRDFIQISKNTLVNLDYIQTFSGTTSGNLTLTMTSSERLVVSRRYVKKIKEALLSAKELPLM